MSKLTSGSTRVLPPSSIQDGTSVRAHTDAPGLWGAGNSNQRNLRLFVLLPKDRNVTGTMYVYQDGIFKVSFPVLGRGSRGPGDTQMKSEGNTPTGTYSGNVFEETKGLPEDSYGPWGRVRLEPTSGNALEAKRLGRSGLLIHSGSLGKKGAFRGKGELRPTHGCLRLSNDDMHQLRDIIKSAQDDGFACFAVDVEITVAEIGQEEPGEE